MGQVKLFGYSDDLIEVEGDIEEEFSWSADSDATRLIVVSDGHVFRVRYDEDGIWRFSVAASGTSSMTKVEGIDDDTYSDVITLEGDDLDWVVFDDRFIKQK